MKQRLLLLTSIVVLVLLALPSTGQPLKNYETQVNSFKLYDAASLAKYAFMIDKQRNRTKDNPEDWEDMLDTVFTVNSMGDEVEAASPSVIFLCFGMNDVGVFEDRVDRYVERYSNVIRRLQSSLPDAVIYVHAALPVTPERLAEEPKYGYLGLYNREMEKACPALGAYFIDSSFILDARPDLFNVDGRHPKEEFYPMWLTYLADLSGLNHD